MRPIRWEQVLSSLGSWYEARALAVVARSGDVGATIQQVARESLLPDSEAREVLARLVARGYLYLVKREDGEVLYRLAPMLMTASGCSEGEEATPAEASGSSESASTPIPSDSGSEQEETQSPRVVARGLLRRYWRYFRSRPNLPWLMQQRRRAAALGLDLVRLMEEAYLNRPAGNPQAYLEAMLRRLEYRRAARSDAGE